MIETTKKILQKLIGNIEKYRVSIQSNSTTHSGFYPLFSISYFCNKTEYHIEIRKNTGYPHMIVLRHENGARVFLDLPEDNKYEILDLCQKLKRACEEYTTNKFEEFADFSATDDNSDLND